MPFYDEQRHGKRDKGVLKSGEFRLGVFVVLISLTLGVAIIAGLRS